MKSYRERRGLDPREPVLSGRCYVDNALVFTVKGTPKVLKAAKAAVEGGPAPAGGVTEVLEYVRACKGRARLTALYRGRNAKVYSAEKMEMALTPEDEAPRAHHVQLADRADGAVLEKKLRAHPDVRRVYRPVIQYPLDFVPMAAPGAPGGGPPGDETWGIDKCRFPEVWDELDRADATDPIAVIDQGKDYGHAELAGRVTTREIPDRQAAPSESIHASAVMGVLAAARGDDAGMSGCCSAPIDLYNVWTTEDGFDSNGFYQALEMVANSGARVLNLSLGSTVSDSEVRDRIAECVARDVIVVAAMGNEAAAGNPKFYPAAYPGVIAVGATTRFDRRTRFSSTGDHVHVAAPGEGIFTVFGADEFEDAHGTSFAAPMVSAAVWLILRARPCWRLKEVKEALAASAVLRTGVLPKEVGHGRLDMVRLLKEVKNRPCGHPGHTLV